MKLPLLLLVISFVPGVVRAGSAPIELHQKLDLSSAQDKTIALTLDACGGGYDEALVQFLIEHRIPVSVFATQRWIDRFPEAVAQLEAHPELFDIEDHGEKHIAAVIGKDRRIYGLRGSPDLEHVRREVAGGARAVEKATGHAPRWYRGATAEYDPEALRAIDAMGYRVAGFSINADQGATLHKRTIVARVTRAQPGDIIIAHMNRPQSDTAAGLAVALPRLRARGFRFVTLRDAQVHAVVLQTRTDATRPTGCPSGPTRSPQGGKPKRACRS